MEGVLSFSKAVVLLIYSKFFFLTLARVRQAAGVDKEFKDLPVPLATQDLPAELW